MKEELNYAILKLEKALLKLKEGGQIAESELEEDGAIQRFEFSFELFWKALKFFLQNEGIEARSPREVFKGAFRLEWLDDEETSLNMLEDRNKTTHIYARETSREIFGRIKYDYIPLMEKVTRLIKSKIPPV